MKFRKLKRITALTLAASLAVVTAATTSCGRRIRGIDAIDWTEYDALIESARTETDVVEHNRLLHEAEDMLMQTECIAPLYNYRDAYLQRQSLTGVYATHYGADHFMFAANESGVITAFLGNAPDSFDPAFATSTQALTVVSNTFTGLFMHGEGGEILTALAESYEIHDDGKTYIFTLHDGLMWSDGSALGASDIIYSWRRASSEDVGSPYMHLFDVIARDDDGKLMISADETDKILTVKLAYPCDYFIELCAFPAFYPVNESCVESANGYFDVYGNIADPDVWTEQIGYVVCGAFIYSGISDGKYIFRPNNRFFRASDVKISSLDVIFGSDPSEAYAQYSTGALDYLGVIPSANHEEAKSNPDYHSDDVNGVYFLAFDYNSSIFSGMEAENAAKLRRAISLFIDREYIVGSIAENGESIATSIVPSSIAGGMYRRNSSVHEYPYDGGGYFSTSTEENRDEARRLIAELGMDNDDDGKLDPEYRFTISYLTGSNVRDISIAQSIQQDLSELGIMVRLSAVEPRVFDFESKIYNYDVIAVGSISYYDDAASSLECWVTDAVGNYSRLGSLLVEESKNAY